MHPNPKPCIHTLCISNPLAVLSFCSSIERTTNAFLLNLAYVAPARALARDALPSITCVRQGTPTTAGGFVSPQIAPQKRNNTQQCRQGQRRARRSRVAPGPREGGVDRRSSGWVRRTHRWGIHRVQCRDRRRKAVWQKLFMHVGQGCPPMQLKSPVCVEVEVARRAVPGTTTARPERERGERFLSPPLQQGKRSQASFHCCALLLLSSATIPPPPSSSPLRPLLHSVIKPPKPPSQPSLAACRVPGRVPAAAVAAAEPPSWCRCRPG